MLCLISMLLQNTVYPMQKNQDCKTKCTTLLTAADNPLSAYRWRDTGFMDPPWGLDTGRTDDWS